MLGVHRIMESCMGLWVSIEFMRVDRAGWMLMGVHIGL